MFTIKAKELWSARMSLDKLMDQEALTGKMKYRLRVFTKEMKQLQEAQVEMLKKHGAESTPMGGLAIPPAKKKEIEAYEQEWKELMEEEIDVKYIPISLKEIEDLVDKETKEPLIKLSAHDYGFLVGTFLEDTEEDSPLKEVK